jgi:hypothetical protein
MIPLWSGETFGWWMVSLLVGWAAFAALAGVIGRRP